VQAFEKNLDDNIKSISKSLIDRTFQTSEYRTKIIHEPKERTIFILPFAPDRIVQHSLMNILEPIWDKMMIHNNFACRVGKGIHAGSRKTMEYVRKNSYCLKCDISKFYPSVNHDILYDILQRKIKCIDTLWLIKDIIYSYTGNGNNIPIGNYTSQWFGNMYLNELDTYVKHELRCKDYLRYCDDFCLFQGLVWQLEVSLRSDVIEKKSPTLHSLLTAADLLDFPGVANEFKSSDPYTDSFLSQKPELIFTKVTEKVQKHSK
jgi:hypothetical protein